MGNSPSRDGHFPIPPGYAPPLYPGYALYSGSATWNPFTRYKMRKREKVLREYLYTTPMVLQYPGAMAITQPGQTMVQPGVPSVHTALPVVPIGNDMTGQVPITVAAQMGMPGGAPVIPQMSAGIAGMPQMASMGFPAFDYSTYLDHRGEPVIRRRSRREQRRRHYRSHRRSPSRSGSSASDSESYGSPSSSDSYEYSRHHRSGSGHNPLPRPPKDVLSSTPFRPLLTQLPSAHYNSWGIGGTNASMSMPRPQLTTYGNIRPRRDRGGGGGFFNNLRRRDYRFGVPSLSAAARAFTQPFTGHPTMAMPEPHPAPPQHGVGNATPTPVIPVIPPSPMMRMPSHDNGPPVIPPGIGMPMPTRAPAGSTPFVGPGGLATPRTPAPQVYPPPGQTMHMPSPSAGPVPMPPPMGGMPTPMAGMHTPMGGMHTPMGGMPTPMGGMPTPMGGAVGTPMPMPTPNIGSGGVRPQTPAHMPMPTPGGVGVVPPVIPPTGMMVGMAMPSPSIGAGVVPQQIKFNGYGQYAGLLCHSVDTVVFEDELYPTALHLFEAHKFLGGHPDLAERIRQCRNVEDVTTLSAEMEHFARPDWGNIALTKMDEVLYLKFRQHSDLRTLLLGTFPSELVYVESGDPFWGDGAGSGRNELGHSLMRVRDRLRAEASR